MVGKTISHYKILEKIGQGGMGEVYRAEDTSLKREVAIKVLPEQFTQDPQRLARFEREAQLLASLNHPNIAAVYSFEHADGIHFLVMELVEGETLAEKVSKGPLPVEEALEVCRQIAEGVEAAHEKGVIHRDLKPANVKITPEGQVKVLDFGLAKALEGEIPAADISHAPTLKHEMTRAGVILGTPAYMSPEQARGKEVDKRTDIWAFGCVLYELLTGRQEFSGETVSDSIAKILQKEPDWEALSENTPWRIKDLLRRCLEKDPHDRLRDMGDARIEIKHAQSEPRVSAAGPLEIPATQSPWPRAIPWGIAGLTTAALLISLVALWPARPGGRGAVPEAPTRRFVLTPAENILVAGISPNGRYIVYVTGTLRDTDSASDVRVWVLDLTQEQPWELESAAGAQTGCLSPDGEYLAFPVGSELKKVSVQGGPAVKLCQLPSSAAVGCSWSPDSRSIVFSSGRPPRIYEIPALGGRPKLLIEPEESEKNKGLVGPDFLPLDKGGRALLFVIASTPSDAEIAVQNLETGQRQVLATGLWPSYSATGHVLYVSGDVESRTLFALPFSLERLQPTGEAFPVVENVNFGGVATDGTLVYTDAGWDVQQQLVWRDRSGARLGEIGQPQRRIQMPALSPDGGRVVVRAIESDPDDNWDIWVHDVARGLKTRLSFDPAVEDRPIWLPGGDTISFSSNRDEANLYNIFLKSADGSAEVQELLVTPNGDFGIDWSSDGKYLVFVRVPPEAMASQFDGNIWYLRSKENQYESAAFVQTNFDEHSPVISSDGRFVAYTSNESGRYEIYVQRFPEANRRWQVSANGGVQPRWRKDGKELFYVEDGAIVAVSVTTRPTFSVGEARRLFEDKEALDGRGHRYDVSADGERFVLVETITESATVSIHVVQNWFAEFKDNQ